MHTIEISPVVIERARKRRGRIEMFDSLDPASTALLVVDMQNCFCQEGQPAYVETTRDIVPNINRLAAALRSAGGLVVWIKMWADERMAASWPVYFQHANSPENAAAMLAALKPGSEGFELCAGLETDPADMVSLKSRFSALIQGSSGLDGQLRARGIDSVMVTGTVTNVCCESTARDANMLNYKTVFVSDANAARTDEEHNATLNSMLNIFCDVRPTEEAIGMLKAAAGQQQGLRRTG